MDQCKELHLSPSFPNGRVSGMTNDRSSNRQHPLKQRQRARLVERLVQVAALRRLDAGGTAVVARAAGEHLRGVFSPALEGREASLVDPDSACMAVVDE